MAAELLARLLAAGPRPRARRWRQLFAACPGPWPEPLGDAVLDRYRRLGAKAALELPAALPVLAARLDPSALPLVETWVFALAGDQGLRRRVQTLGHALSLRAVIQREFPHDRPPPRPQPAFICRNTAERNADRRAGAADIVRPHAEDRYAAELAALAAADDRPRPPSWRLSPWAVATYLLGGRLADGTEITPKYIGQRRLVEVAVATLATDRALLLLGVPGTAKTWVSEHLAAAVSGDSTLLVQGTSGTPEEAIRYGWNYARLLAEGPSRAAVVASPVMRAMERGAVARIEELTRIPSDVQDALITILSEKTLPIPELDDEVQARQGFNVIATANDRDRGVNELSSALKRRFNTVVLPLPADSEEEVGIVARRVADLGAALGLPAELDAAGRDPPGGHGVPGAAVGGDRRRAHQAEVAHRHAVDRGGHLGGDQRRGAGHPLRRRDAAGRRRRRRPHRRSGEGPGAGRAGLGRVPRDRRQGTRPAGTTSTAPAGSWPDRCDRGG